MSHCPRDEKWQSTDGRTWQRRTPPGARGEVRPDGSGIWSWCVVSTLGGKSVAVQGIRPDLRLAKADADAVLLLLLEVACLERGVPSVIGENLVGRFAASYGD